jgi:hypothetical protein
VGPVHVRAAGHVDPVCRPRPLCISSRIISPAVGFRAGPNVRDESRVGGIPPEPASLLRRGTPPGIVGQERLAARLGFW